MIQINVKIEQLKMIVQERIDTASSIFTKAAYIIVLEAIKERFKEISEKSIVIDKDEYKELLYLKRDKIFKDKKDNFYKEVYKPFAILDSTKYDVEINKIEDTIEKLNF